MAEQEIDGSTLILGIIGDPIAQAKTPQVINAIFAERGANIRCVPLHISAADLATAIPGLKALRNLIGLCVTVPHKHSVLAFCDSLDGAAQRTGTVNVMRRESDGSFRGSQFDGRGFVGGLIARGHDPRGRGCLVIGAGGAAAAIVPALIDAGAARIGIANRTRDKAEKLAQAVNATSGGALVRACDPVPRAGQMVVNATSLGLSEGDALPLDPALIDASMLVAEVVAKPEITHLLREAAARGAATHSGIHMIAGQVPLIAAHFLELHAPDLEANQV